MASIATTLAFFLFPFLVLSNLSNGYESLDQGFSIELIHRDSPQSPFYNPLDTNSERLRNAVQRSMSLIKRLHHRSSTKTTSFQSKFVWDSGEYFTKISVGTPPFEVILLVDTGSEITWFQCKPCMKCFPQMTPIFDIQKSSTFKPLLCKSDFCQKTKPYREVECKNTATNICPYYSEYGDGSYTFGALATETVTFGSPKGKPISIPKFILGCGLNNSATFKGGNGTGLLGLGRSPLSIVSQLSVKKFSYCLLPWGSKDTSTLKFGTLATISRKGSIVSTPFLPLPNTPYYLKLEGVSVGNKRFTMTDNGTQGYNTVIDSGGTVSALPTKLYNMIESEMKKSIKAKPIKNPKEPELTLCYKSNLNVGVPVVTYHFAGADLKLSKANTFFDQEGGIECFVTTAGDGVPIFGNTMQRNFQIEYDLDRKMVSFAQADCTKF